MTQHNTTRTDRKLATQLGMLDPDVVDAKGLPMTCRAVFIIGKDKKLKLSLLYPASTGRSFQEIIRVVDSLQLTAEKQVCCVVLCFELGVWWLVLILGNLDFEDFE